MPFIYNYSHFQYSFCNQPVFFARIYNYSNFQYSFYNQPVFFAQIENANKLWNNNRNVHVNERNQNKNKTKLSHVQIDHALILFDLAHKLCNGIIKEWLHCLTSDSKGRFLVIIMLMFGSARCPVML